MNYYHHALLIIDHANSCNPVWHWASHYLYKIGALSGS